MTAYTLHVRNVRQSNVRWNTRVRFRNRIRSARTDRTMPVTEYWDCTGMTEAHFTLPVQLAYRDVARCTYRLNCTDYTCISDDSIYRNIDLSFSISICRIVSAKKISTFSIYRDILIYRDIFGIIIGVNTCSFLRQTFKAFTVFVISSFTGNVVLWITENQVIVNRTALRVTQTHIFM